MWGVPARNTIFTGREGQLASLHEKLSFSNSLEDESCLIKQIELVGIGGVGKTQLSIEYCHRFFGSFYGLVVMIRAETHASIAAELRRLALDLGLLEPAQLGKGVERNENDTSSSLESVIGEEVDDDEVVEIIRRKLARCRFRWLFVFDNVEDPFMVQAYLPRGQLLGSQSQSGPSQQSQNYGGGHVIITSRTSRSNNNNNKSINNDELSTTTSRGLVGCNSTILLECFDRKESLRFLDLSLQQETVSSLILVSDESTSLSVLADRLGHLPLALAMASAYLARYCCVCKSVYMYVYVILLIILISFSFFFLISYF